LPTAASDFGRASRNAVASVARMVAMRARLMPPCVVALFPDVRNYFLPIIVEQKL
jgi:hypothetical protein